MKKIFSDNNDSYPKELFPLATLQSTTPPSAQLSSTPLPSTPLPSTPLRKRWRGRLLSVAETSGGSPVVERSRNHHLTEITGRKNNLRPRRGYEPYRSFIISVFSVVYIVLCVSPCSLRLVYFCTLGNNPSAK
jgi:hypothetical protein